MAEVRYSDKDLAEFRALIEKKIELHKTTWTR